jgi:hypothetical protein
MTTIEAQVGLAFRIQHADGRAEQLTVDAERALVGSAAHCEVRLDPESVGPEHLEVVIANGQVYMTTRGGCRLPMLGGAHLQSGNWQPGQVLELGGARLTVGVVDLTDRRRPPSPFWLVAPVPFVIFFVTMFVTQARAAVEPPIPPAPPLFDAPVTTCPTPAGQPKDLVGALANEKQRLALAHRERGPFSRADAVEAVTLFEVAAACFKVAKMPEEERAATSSGTKLRQKLEEEYHVRRVRLEHDYRIQDPIGAGRELAVLIPMTAKRSGPYVQWLAFVDRYVKLETEKRGRILGK